MSSVILGIDTQTEQARFESLINQGSSREELQQFAVDHIPDFTTFLTTTLLDFQRVYLTR